METGPYSPREHCGEVARANLSSPSSWRLLRSNFYVTVGAPEFDEDELLDTRILEAWRDPDHDEHKGMRRWVGRKFDPERFDLEATNKAIARAVRASKGDYRFRHTRPS